MLFSRRARLGGSMAGCLTRILTVLLMSVSLTGVPVDRAEADEPACPAADGAEAALDVGARYDVGSGVAQDFAVAAACYRLAAEQGSRAAAFNVGAMYDNGRGVAHDPAAAARWYLMAA